VAPRVPEASTDVPRGRSRTGEVVVVRSASIGQAADILSEEQEAGTIVSADFIRLRPKPTLRPGFLSLYLNSEPGKLLQDQIAYGTIQPKIGQGELGGLPVPNIDADVQLEMEADTHRWRRLINEARNCIADAKSAVEALLDGSLDTASLMTESAEIERWLTETPSPHATGN